MIAESWEKIECQKIDNSAVMETVCWNEFSGSAAYGRRRSKMIRRVRALNNSTLCDLSKLLVYLRLSKNLRLLDGTEPLFPHLVKFSCPENSLCCYELSACLNLI